VVAGQADFCKGTQPQRINKDNGDDMLKFMLEALPEMNDAEALQGAVFNYVDDEYLEDLVYIDNEQLAANPATNHAMFGYFVGEEIFERTAGVGEKYQFTVSSKGFKTWTAA